MDRVIRDGKVAVLVSPGYGAGWSTWADRDIDINIVLFEPEVVAWVLNGKEGPLPDLKTKYGWEYFYDGGGDDLQVVWIEQGQRFRIHEYDGSEHVVLEQDEEWFTA